MADRIMTMTPSEHATVLAALAWWQTCLFANRIEEGSAVHNIATDHGTVKAIPVGEIDTLFAKVKAATTLRDEDR